VTGILHHAAGRVGLQFPAHFDRDIHEQRQGFQRFQRQGGERRTAHAIFARQAADAAIGTTHHAAHESEFERPIGVAARNTAEQGTPENVGPVVAGDVMEGHIDGLPNISVRVV
jgi:hypothetical protein